MYNANQQAFTSNHATQHSQRRHTRAMCIADQQVSRGDNNTQLMRKRRSTARASTCREVTKRSHVPSTSNISSASSQHAQILLILSQLLASPTSATHFHQPLRSSTSVTMKVFTLLALAAIATALPTGGRTNNGGGGGGGGGGGSAQPVNTVTNAAADAAAGVLSSSAAGAGDRSSSSSSSSCGT